MGGTQAANALVDAPTSSEWIWVNLAMVFVLADTIGLGLLPAGLCVYHAYLIVTGRTTWEDLKSEKISYLQNMHRLNPFDEGPLRNVAAFCCGWRPAFVPRRWRYVPAQIERARRKRSVADVGVCDNLFANRHYSCC
eukprot:Amastigsp_a177114_7.p3 type:complete len:137 gc:universal Amastigsp_a177114_7:1-411(+)